VLECFDPKKRIELLMSLLKEEAEILECELQIHKRVRSNLNQNQKEFYLREQIRVIKNELGESDDIDEYGDKILTLKAPDEVKEKLAKELDRLTKMPFGSSEASVIRSYLDTCLEIPWQTSTTDRLDVAAASKILDADHDGLNKVKDRILEFLAVKQLNPSLKNQILCLVGPPGVGKTSIAASIARAMKRKYVRVSLGGVRDEADIRGHRKTYVGSMPGRIVNALVEAKSKNPLMLLDEIDKLTRDSHGDPASALLEVLDGEQNHTFRDHFVEMPLDLSECLFIATANTLDTVPKPLLDRMEVIELTTYTRTEKLAIAKNHLIPKQLKRHGLNKRLLNIKDDAICELIDFYTRESGVRSLERKIAELARKAARRLVEDEKLKSIKISATDVSLYLGARKIIPETVSDLDEVGVVNGLAYTSVGGDVLKVEAAILDGSGKLELTGSLGDVMKESAKIAVSIVRSLAKDYGIDPDFHKNKDIHLHFPEGATPKDGPSAGVTIVTALVSALSGRPVKRNVAMTGEVSLRGKVLAIGGLKEKTMAAYSYGIKDVLIPRDNMRNLDECDTEATAHLNFIPCDTVQDVLKSALADN
jgi:ATP-dependent Lon protease